MHEIQKIDIRDVAAWHELRPAEASAPASRLVPAGGEPYPKKILDMHREKLAVGAIGCHMVADARLNVGGLLTLGGTLLEEKSILPAHCERYWLEGKMRRDRGLFAPATTEIDRPTICLYSAGVKVYGHWLMEFIPRAALARAFLGDAFADAVIPLPKEAPWFVDDMLETFVGVDRSRIFRFDPEQTDLILRQACVPSYAHTRYHLHSYFREVYAPLQGPPGHAPRDGRKLWIVRADFTKVSAGERRVLLNQDELLDDARALGYEPIDPAAMSLREQVALFRSARVVVGDFGSALHNTIHSLADTHVVTIRAQNSIQSRIAARYDHVMSYVLPQDEQVEGRSRSYTVDRALMRAVLADAGAGAA